MKLSLVLATLPLAFAAPSVRRRDEPAPIVRPRGAAKAIPNKYIVVMKKSEMSVQSVITPLNVKPDHVYNSRGFKGFAAELDDEKLASVQDDPSVSPHPA